MSFKKPFRAIPVRLGEYQRKQQSRGDARAILKTVVIALVIGAASGGAISAYEGGHLAKPIEMGRQLAVAGGFARQRSPQIGDYWSGCNDARAAGVTPLRFGEPGYRPEMDGDGDGLACEPYYGS